MQRFTAAVSDEAMEAAKIAAIRAKKPLVYWAGEIIEAHLETLRKAAKAGKRMPKGK